MAIPAHRSVSTTIILGARNFCILSTISVDWLDPPGKEEILFEVLVNLVVGSPQRQTSARISV
jgi:hypothetical protein